MIFILIRRIGENVIYMLHTASLKLDATHWYNYDLLLKQETPRQLVRFMLHLDSVGIQQKIFL